MGITFYDAAYVALTIGGLPTTADEDLYMKIKQLNAQLLGETNPKELAAWTILL